MIACFRGSVAHLFVLACVMAALSGCSDGTAPEPGPTGSFARLQSEILDPKCVPCHTAGTPYGEESGLILQAGVSHANLVGVPPRNSRALAEGLSRVRGGDPQKSLFFLKLLWGAEHHAGRYGTPMPLGGPPLSVGEVEFVKRWIAAGAPSTGEVVDASLLEDTTPQTVDVFQALPPPERGHQLHVERFEVWPNAERELFTYRRVGNAEEIWVNRIEVAMRPNSHHFILYAYPPGTPASALPQHDLIRDLWRPDGSRNNDVGSMAQRRYFGGAQTELTDRRFPDGVAIRLPANASLDLNSHYVNRTGEPITGEVYANLHTIDRSAVVHEAHSLFLNNTNITLPPKQRTVVSRTFVMPEPRTILTLTSHMHERGEQFVIRIVGGPRDGQEVYRTTSWAHPDVVDYDPPIELKAGEALRSEVTFNNTTDRTITFGLTSEDEMAIIVGYYY